jgi:hypothetical protein
MKICLKEKGELQKKKAQMVPVQGMYNVGAFGSLGAFFLPPWGHALGPVLHHVMQLYLTPSRLVAYDTL